MTTHDSLWSTSVGATFAWHSLRNSARATFSHSVSDGGGVIGTSQVSTIFGDYRRMLTQKMDVTVGARYFHDVSTMLSSRSYDNLSFNAALSYTLAKSLLASATYAYVHQTQSSTVLLGSSTYNANIVGASISYSWNHPLGR